MTIQPPRPEPRESERLPNHSLASSLTAASEALKLLAITPQAIFDIFHQCTGALGLRGGIALLDETGKFLVFKTVAISMTMVSILKRFEGAAGYRAEGYALPVQRVKVYQKVIETQQPVYLPDTSTVAAQAMPDIAQPLLTPLIRIMGFPPGIYTALVRDQQSVGMLNLVGKLVRPGDIQVVVEFANNVTEALDRSGIILYNQTI